MWPASWAPGHPEFGIGAIAPGVRFLNENGQELLRRTPQYIEQVTAEETVEMERRQRHYRNGRPMPTVQGRTVILVDDGLATGVTARAAIRSLRKQGAGCIVLAVPVCAPETVGALSHEADHVVCAAAPRPFYAIGQWYADFEQTSDQEAMELLKQAGESSRTEGGSTPSSLTAQR